MDNLNNKYVTRWVTTLYIISAKYITRWVITQVRFPYKSMLMTGTNNKL